MLTDYEKTMLKYAQMPLTPGEKRELLHFLGYPEVLPNGYPARVESVVTKILESRS